ncbi:DUF899 domain-containing protein [Pararhizobium mangrovi]|uniref:DUF899 domain-containing protein n=2 Tax=Pararhizobium mangrovi TaxID=2590452 RepID=A0A506U0I4_9HYPH|nr:DUF899 family protein [Pararhizobium mangrovi]TPW26484.1 DUF899 domain-containing protein [Pararhizobium mangrovi]
MDTLTPAADLARAEPMRWPNESADYRAARTALLVEEIELRRHITRVNDMRRALPEGGAIPQDYRFDGPEGPVALSQMFGKHDTLIVYCMMYGPKRETGCPMCSAQLDAWDGEARHIEKRAALAVVARSPIERIRKYAKERGWTHLSVYSDPTGDFWADYNRDRDADMPAYAVFHRGADGTIRHFWSPEAGFATADPGQDPHLAPDMNPLWILLDTTPEGRGTDWYPKLDD